MKPASHPSHTLWNPFGIPTFPPPRRLDTCLLMPLKPKHRYRKGLVTDVSGPQRNACPGTLNWLTAHHYRTAKVTMDFEDYLWNGPYARCVANHDDKAIQALHASYLAAAGQSMNVYRLLSYELYGREIPYILLLHVGAFEAVMLPDLLKLYRRAGFTFVSLPQAASDPAYALDPDLAIQGGGTLMELVAATRKLPYPPNPKPYKQLSDFCLTKPAQ